MLYPSYPPTEKFFGLVTLSFDVRIFIYIFPPFHVKIQQFTTKEMEKGKI